MRVFSLRWTSIVIGALVFGAIVFGVWWKKNSDRLDPRIQAAFQSFESGRQQPQKAPLSIVCSGFKGAEYYICLEGFFYQLSVDLILEKKKPAQVIAKLEAKASSLPARMWPLWAVGLGFSISEMGEEVESFTDEMSNDVLAGYVVDGWSMLNIKKMGFSRAETLCQSRNSFHEECRWGLGRGLYFYGGLNSIESSHGNSVQAGFDFASVFSVSVAKTDVERNGHRLGLLARRLMGGREVVLESEALVACIRNHHIARCMNLL